MTPQRTECALLEQLDLAMTNTAGSGGAVWVAGDWSWPKSKIVKDQIKARIYRTTLPSFLLSPSSNTSSTLSIHHYHTLHSNLLLLHTHLPSLYSNPIK